jgi:xanthine dehydrogenase accessory factor
LATNIFQAALDLRHVGQHAVFVTVVSAEGFVPVSARRKLLVTSTGLLTGHSGSDILDADIRAEAQRVMAQGPQRPTALRVLTQEAVASGWYRSWGVELLIEPVDAQGDEMLGAVVALEKTGHRGALVTILTEHPRFPPRQRKLLVCDDGTTVGSLRDTQLEAAVRDRSQEVMLGEQCLLQDYPSAEGSPLRLLFEPILPTPTVWIFGGGHIVSPLTRAATLAGFSVCIIDDDPAFANPERFPEAEAVLAMPFTHVGEKVDFGQDDYVVVMTRGHAHDHTVLEQIYDCPARYLGMLGSKSRIARLWQDLEARGIARQWLAWVHAPIGISIQARSPEEIAISILAELIQVRRTSPVVIPQRQSTSGRWRQ